MALRADGEYAGTTYVPVFDATGEEIGGYEIQIADLGNRQRALTITGHTPSNDPAAPWYVARTIQATVTVQEGSPFTEAVFANRSLLVAGGAQTWSYDSRQGTAPSGAALRANGDVGCNGSVLIAGAAVIHGDVIAPTSRPRWLPAGRAYIIGQWTTAPQPRNVDPVVIPEGVANRGYLWLADGSTLTLGPGTYWYRGINLAGGARLVFAGPATVYVSRSFHL